MSDERLKIEFSYDHARGSFTAHLSNGASFPLDYHAARAAASKLENALRLFAKGVVASNSGKWARPIQVKEGDLGYSYNEVQVRRFEPGGRPKIELSELDIDLEDLEI